MKKQPTKKQKRKLAELMEQLDWFFGVTNQERHLYYAKENDPTSPDCAADITITEKYQRLVINIYPNFWEHNEDTQRLLLTHEYTHYVVQPLQKIAKDLLAGRLHTEEDIIDATEKVTSSVSIMLDALLSGHRKYMLKAYEHYLPKKKTNATNTTKIKRRTTKQARV